MRYDDRYGRWPRRVASRRAHGDRLWRATFDRDRPGYGRDYWWLGEHALPDRGRTTYDDAYERFDRRQRPRFSPVGGMYHATGGSFSRDRLPRPIREPMWMSEWTRWF